MTNTAQRLDRHQAQLKRCRLCPSMLGPVVTGAPVVSPVLLIGQAPGAREGPAGRPFAWTAGKTLFSWFARIGLHEEEFRKRIYMAAVCRCYPGKNPRGGDRVPSQDEIANCARWLGAEIRVLRPTLILPVGKLAIAQFLTPRPLRDIVGRIHRIDVLDRPTDVVPLPHPSGASTWHRTEPGQSLLATALRLIGSHPAWKKVIASPP